MTHSRITTFVGHDEIEIASTELKIGIFGPRLFLNQQGKNNKRKLLMGIGRRIEL